MQQTLGFFNSLRLLLLLLLVTPFFAPFLSNAALTNQRKAQLKDLVKQTWYHGFGNYMKHAFPDDELQPLSCRGIGYDHENPQNHERNDVLGDFSMTLIDSIDTLIVLGDYKNFELAIRTIIKTIPNFNLNSKVQVFETTIRVLGGLLSGHLFIKNPPEIFLNQKNFTSSLNLLLDDYHDQLLVLAKDLADRLLPAFEASRTGIPYARVNLRYGVLPGEGTDTCTAGAGSLLLEFGTLSRLVGDPKYENVAKKAFYALWDRRSQINLFGNTIDLQTGYWSYGISSIGAGIDSFYEYILKSHILLQDDSFLDLWNQAYKSVMTYMKSSDGFWYRGVNMQTGAVATTTIDSLAAFWPGLQVLAGDIEAAIKSHMIYANLWARYSGIPEVFDIHKRQATALGYPLRPEFIESNYFLYRATKDEYYLEVAERVITDLVNRTWVDCGLASIANLQTGKLEDRMHSFMLSETLKYLYLTFDEENPINHSDEPFIFTTEGHILYIPNAQDMAENGKKMKNQDWAERESLDSDQIIKVSKEEEEEERSRKTSKFLKNNDRNFKNTCQVFSPSVNGTTTKHSSQLKLSITGRSDFEYAKMITGSQQSSINIHQYSHHNTTSPYVDSSTSTSSSLLGNSWFEFGICEVPSVDDNLIELIFSRTEEDIDRGTITDKVKIFQGPMSKDNNNYTKDSDDSLNVNQNFALVKNLTGLTFSLRKLHDRDSYEIVNIGSYSLPTKTTVILSDPYAVKVLKPQKESDKLSDRDREHLTAIRVSCSDLTSRRSGVIERVVMMATFGPDVRIPGSSRLSVGNEPIELVTMNESNQFGCLPMEKTDVHGRVVLVKRGQCTFADKLEGAILGGALGVIIGNEDESLIIPTSDRIRARDEREDLTSGIEDDDESLLLSQLEGGEKNSIPLLFANLESSNLILDWSQTCKTLLVQILSNPFIVLDNPLIYPATSSDPTLNHPNPPQLIVINGYPLSNLILKSD